MTSAVLEERIAELAATPSGPATFAERARQAIAELEGPVTLTTLARRLSLGERTLRRRLGSEGLSMRALVDGVRLERARAMLAAGSSVKETAFALGFSEPSAFSRAYKRWTGAAPRERS